MAAGNAYPATLFQKLWTSHLVSTNQEEDLVFIDRVMLHERTGGVALRSLSQRNLKVAAPSQVFVTMDHVVDTLPGRSDNTTMPTGGDFIRATRAEAHKAGLRLYDLDDPAQGIVHVISPEQGIILPGLTLVCPDSHTSTQGALGALAWGIGSTEAEHALATRTLRVVRPRTMRIFLTGRLQDGVTAKDLALLLISTYGSNAARGHVIEFAGAAINAMDVEARMTLCNMAAELGAFTALIAPDDKVIAYLRNRPHAPKAQLWDEALHYWNTLTSDDGAVFDMELSLDANKAAPMVSWGTSPSQAMPIDGEVPLATAAGDAAALKRAITYMGLEPGAPLQGLPISAAFIGSCTNSRISDLRRAAKILKGRRIADGVRAICVPGSMAVKRQAEEEGVAKILIDAGFEWRESGCSMCFFAGGESFGERERVISSTNRNFESRQGPNSRTHIASPETVAASAIAGAIADPRKYVS